MEVFGGDDGLMRTAGCRKGAGGFLYKPEIFDDLQAVEKSLHIDKLLW
jgi:hypothetical protein